MSAMARVTPANKCVICGHGSWCLIGRSCVICMRVVSPRPKTFKGGEVGYIHPHPDPNNRPKFTSKPPKQVPQINVKRVLSDWRRAYPNNYLPFLAHDLGVSIRSLEELGCQYAGDYHNAWGFLMKDGYGNPIGIRIRNLFGQKWAVTGSQAGIFIPKVPFQYRVFIAEGPTDVAAGLSIGLYVIGRPSCSGGVSHIVDWFKKHRAVACEAVIIADNDEPGIKGAQELQRWLPVPSCILILPSKDLREAVKSGIDKSTIDSMIEQLVWTQPKEVC